MCFAALPQRATSDPQKSPHVLCAGNERGQSRSGAGIGARRPRGAAGEGAQGGSLGSPIAREHGSSLRSPCNGRAAAPRTRAAPAQGDRSLGLSPRNGPVLPKGTGPSCRGAPPASGRRGRGGSGTRRSRDTKTAGRGKSGPLT